MDVIYFHQHFSIPKGSTGTRSYEMAKILIESGHNVTMVCGKYDQSVTGLNGKFKKGKRQGFVENIRVVEFDLGYSNNHTFTRRTFIFFKFAFRSIKMALTEKYDVIFATSTPLTAGIPGIFAKIFRRKTFIFEVRDLWPELPKAMGVIKNPVILMMMSVLELACYKNATQIIGLSPGMIKGIASRGIPRTKIHLIPNGSDIGLFRLGSNKNSRFKKNESDKVFLYAGTHGIANGLDALLNVALVLHKRNFNCAKFVLIGSGKLKPELVKKAHKHNLSNITFLDPVDKYSLARLLNETDVCLQILSNIPAFYDGTSPNKFFDYLAAGKPIIINYPGWLASYITQYNCGYSVEPDNATEFANVIEHICENDALIQQLGKNSSLLAQQVFDRKKLAKDFLKVIESAAK